MAEAMVGPTQSGSLAADDRILPSGDEAGTAPGDRPFRPDVEGLRAVAVLLVVLFHSGVSFVSGGFVGVDVFFVISGFVITGVLLRERTDTGRTSILSFYGRRARRIIPAATLVIIATVVAAYYFLGIGGGIPTATDGRWAAVFLANFHFISTGTNYLSSQSPPSPLQNFWSLAVEEQFYVVYPTLFLLVAAAKGFTFRARMAIGLTAVICVSLAWSVVNTHNNPVNAFFSPFTRAWELALGALVAVATPWLLKVPRRMAAVGTWVGLGAVLIAAHFYSSQTPYPGAYVVLPVVGTALIIGGGMRAHATGAEALLRLPPFRWLGRLSYSLYLWHWPILIIAAEYAGKTTLSVKDNLGWDLVGLGVSVVTYRLLENPVRHSLVLRRNRWASVGLGVSLIALTLGVIAVQTNGNVATAAPTSTALVPEREVLRAVAQSRTIEQLPADLSPPLAGMLADPDDYFGSPGGIAPQCNGLGHSTVAQCTFGHGSRTLVLYGDSHAGMWFRAFDDIASRAHWKLIVLYMDACSATLLPIHHDAPGAWAACDQWHRRAATWIKQIDPALLVVSQTSGYLQPDGTPYTPSQWQRGLETLLARVTGPSTEKLVMANLVKPANAGADCLARHTDDVQACSGPPSRSSRRFNAAERRGAAKAGARFINVVPWFCTTTCSSVIGNEQVYLASDHVTLQYSLHLEGVLSEALDLPKAAASTSASTSASASG